MANHGTLKNTHIISSITMVTPEYHFFSFFYYYVVIKFKCLFNRPMSFLLNKFLHMHDHNDKLYCHIHVLERAFNSQWLLYYVHTCTISLCIEGKTKCRRGVISEQSISNVYIQWLMIILWLVYPSRM